MSEAASGAGRTAAAAALAVPIQRLTGADACLPAYQLPCSLPPRFLSRSLPSLAHSFLKFVIVVQPPPARQRDSEREKSRPSFPCTK